MITYSQYKDKPVDAIVVVTCDWSHHWTNFIQAEMNKYCVLHGTIDKKVRNQIYHHGYNERLCWLNPMFKDECYFLPSSLPSRDILDQDEMVHELVPSRQKDEIRLCIIGARAWDAVADILLSVGAEYLREHRVQVHIHTYRKNLKGQSFKVYKESTKQLEDIVSFALDEPFLLFQGRIAQCSLMLPMLDPETQPKYFPGDSQKLSGQISQMVAYKIPSVMREELHAVYKEHLIGVPVKLHDNSTDNFVSAIKSMIMDIQSNATNMDMDMVVQKD